MANNTKTTAQKTGISKWEAFKIKLSLLRIWLLKNLKTFILVGVAIYAILILTGCIKNDILGLGLSPIIHNAKTAEGNVWLRVILDIVSILGSIASAIGLVYRRIQFIELKDIKSKQLKLALISAGLYFNKDGKLVKRAEQVLQTDIDKDGKINQTPVEEKSALSDLNVAKNVVNAFSELGTILTTRISTPLDHDTILESANLKETKEAFDAINNQPIVIDSPAETTETVEPIVVVNTTNEVDEQPVLKTTDLMQPEEHSILDNESSNVSTGELLDDWAVIAKNPETTADEYDSSSEAWEKMAVTFEEAAQQQPEPVFEPRQLDNSELEQSIVEEAKPAVEQPVVVATEVVTTKTAVESVDEILDGWAELDAATKINIISKIATAVGHALSVIFSKLKALWNKIFHRESKVVEETPDLDSQLSETWQPEEIPEPVVSINETPVVEESEVKKAQQDARVARFMATYAPQETAKQTIVEETKPVEPVKVEKPEVVVTVCQPVEVVSEPIQPIVKESQEDHVEVQCELAKTDPNHVHADGKTCPEVSARAARAAAKFIKK